MKPSLFTLSRESYRDDDERTRFIDEFLGASDRACAIIGAAYVERSLILLICTKLRRLTKPESDALFFDQGALLHTFSERVDIAYALELISNEERAALDAIRRIRNAFAHAIRPITFENVLIIEACRHLQRRTFAKTGETETMNEHRRKYVECVAGIARDFAAIFGKHPNKAEISKLITDPYWRST